MFTRFSHVVLSVALLAVISIAQSKPLTNEDVMAMAKGGLGEGTIVSAIQSQDSNFDISATGLLQMKKAGIPPKVMETVIAVVGKKKAASDTAAAVRDEPDAKTQTAPLVPAAMLSTMLPGQPSVVLVLAGQKQPIPMDHTQIVETKTKASTLGALASDGSVVQAMSGVTQSIAAAGMMKGSSKMASTAMMANPMVGGAMLAGSLFAHRKSTVTEVWAILGPKSTTVIHLVQPAFEVHCDNIAGINPDEYVPVLLKLAPTANNYRLVGATQAKSDAMQSTTADWGMYSSFVEELAPGQATKVASGSYRLETGSALPPGEYAVALRPANKDKKFSGSNISQNVGDGMIFNSVWSFEIAQ